METLKIPFLADLAAIRHDLHAHPELAFNEFRTAEVVARELVKCGLEVDCGLATTGVVGILRKGHSCRAIGLRADMDALPLQEKNDFPHRSRSEGRMHACGHDGHTTMLLGAARYMAEHGDELDFDGSVYFIFQPAEESEGGAAVMITDGLFEKFPMDAVFGLHNWPGIPVGEMAVMPGPVMAGTCTFEISVRGHGCHAAMPHQGVDTLVASSQLVMALQTVVARNLHPCESAVVSVTQIHAGEAWNIIPDDAVLRGTIRSFNGATQELVERAVERLCSGIASAFGAQISVRFDHRYPPTVNSARKRNLSVGGEPFAGARQGARKRVAVNGGRGFRLHAARKTRLLRLAGQWPGKRWLHPAQSPLRLQQRDPAARRELLGCRLAERVLAAKPATGDAADRESHKGAGRDFFVTLCRNSGR
jgi:amidohydrolase